jgi:hypothetical protein
LVIGNVLMLLLWSGMAYKNSKALISESDKQILSHLQSACTEAAAILTDQNAHNVALTKNKENKFKPPTTYLEQSAAVQDKIKHFGAQIDSLALSLPPINRATWVKHAATSLQTILYQYKGLPMAFNHRESMGNYDTNLYETLFQNLSEQEINTWLQIFHGAMRIYEYEQLRHLAQSSQLNSAIFFNQFGFALIPQSTTLQQGDTLNVTILWAMRAANNLCKVHIAGQTLAIDAQTGYATYAIPCKKAGKYRLNGTLDLPPDDLHYTCSFAQNYEVREPCKQ